MLVTINKVDLKILTCILEIDKNRRQEVWNLFTSREAARSREGVVLPGEEEEDVCLKKGSFASWCMVAALFGLLWLL